MSTAASQLLKSFATREPRRVAECVEHMSDSVGAEYLSQLDRATAATVLSYMNPTLAHALIQKLSQEITREIVEELSSDSLSRIFRGMPQTQLSELFQMLKPELVRKVKARLQYAPNTAAAHAHSRVVTATLGQSVKDVIAILESGIHKAFDYVYVTDRENTLRGVITVSRLFRANPQLLVDQIMSTEVTVLPGFTGIPGILRHPGWRHYHALPVCDQHNQFLGALTYGELQRIQGDLVPTQKSDRVGLFMALGELFWLGIVGMLEAFGSTAKEKRANDQ